MKHLLEAASELELRKAALALQSDVIEETDGRVSVEMELLRKPIDARWQIKDNGIVLTFKSDLTKAETKAVIGELSASGVIAIFISFKAPLSVEEMMKDRRYIINLFPSEQQAAVKNILRRCFAVSAGPITPRIYDDIRNRKVMIKDDSKLWTLKYFVRNERLTVGEYGAFADKNAYSRNTAFDPSRLQRYRIEAITTGAGLFSFPSIEAMMKHYDAKQLHELWAGLKLKVYNYETRSENLLGNAAHIIFSHDGRVLKFFSLAEAV